MSKKCPECNGRGVVFGPYMGEGLASNYPCPNCQPIVEGNTVKNCEEYGVAYEDTALPGD